MASYRVSFKLLSQQPEEIRAAAAMLSDYAERIVQIRSRLSSDEMLEPMRSGLQKLKDQMDEARVSMFSAADFLGTCVTRYTDLELRQVEMLSTLRANLPNAQ